MSTISHTPFNAVQSNPYFGAMKRKVVKKNKRDLEPRHDPDGRQVLMDVSDMHLRYPVPKSIVETVMEKVYGLFNRFPGVNIKVRSKPSEIIILNDISFKVRAGEVVGIVGESGCGKSTVGKGVLFLAEGANMDGTFWVDGLGNLKEISAEELRSEGRRMMQMAFQNSAGSLSPRRSAGQSVTEGIETHFRKPREFFEKRPWLKKITPKSWQVRKYTGDELDQEAIRLFEMVKIPPEDRNKYPHEFSGGQQTRICVARALSMGAKIIFADEITSALDVTVQTEVLKIIDKLRAELGFGMMFVAHDLNVVDLISDRILVMYLGEIVEDRPVDAKPTHPYTHALRNLSPEIRDDGEDPVEKALMPGEVGNLLAAQLRNKGCRFQQRCAFSLAMLKSGDADMAEMRRMCTDEHPDLETVEDGAPGQRARCHHTADFRHFAAMMEAFEAETSGETPPQDVFERTPLEGELGRLSLEQLVNLAMTDLHTQMEDAPHAFEGTLMEQVDRWVAEANSTEESD